jgi:hypothetical protein
MGPTPVIIPATPSRIPATIAPCRVSGWPFISEPRVRKVMVSVMGWMIGGLERMRLWAILLRVERVWEKRVC